MTHEENKGIDYTKDNIYDAIGRPDLKPKADIVEDYLTQEAIRIVDGEFNEETGLWKSHPITCIMTHDCEDNNGDSICSEIWSREDKIKFIRDKITGIV